jgi:hypothetical protein
MSRGEIVYKRGFPNPGLSAHQRCTARTGKYILQGLFELSEKGLTFQ